MNETVVYGAIAVAVTAALTAAYGLFRRRPWLSRIQRRPMLTTNETEFFRRLQRSLPGFLVFPQVAFSSLLTDDGKLSAKARWAVRAKFDRKVCDFVVCDRQSLGVIALVELDDRTHIASQDRNRDQITKAAGYQTFRFQSRQKPSETELVELFRHSQAWANAR